MSQCNKLTKNQSLQAVGLKELVHPRGTIDDEYLKNHSKNWLFY